MLLIAHSAHWITGVAYFLPVLAFLAWPSRSCGTAGAIAASRTRGLPWTNG